MEETQKDLSVAGNLAKVMSSPINNNHSVVQNSSHLDADSVLRMLRNKSGQDGFSGAIDSSAVFSPRCCTKSVGVQYDPPQTESKFKNQRYDGFSYEPENSFELSVISSKYEPDDRHDNTSIFNESSLNLKLKEINTLTNTGSIPNMKNTVANSKQSHGKSSFPL